MGRYGVCRLWDVCVSVAYAVGLDIALTHGCVESIIAVVFKPPCAYLSMRHLIRFEVEPPSLLITQL